MGKPAWVGLVSAIVLAFICGGIYAFTERADVAEATLSEVDTIVGVDADPTGNTATSLGTIDRCISVSSLDTFYVDLFVKDVTELRHWTGTFTFDSSVVDVTALSVDPYLLAVDPSSNVPLWRFFDCYPDKCTVGALDTASTPGSAESGSGVLGRLELTALSAGTSELYFTLWWPFGISGVYLEDLSGAPIGDLDGDPDHYFDGLVFNAIVVVDGPCPTDADLDGFTNDEESVDGSDLLDVNSTPEMCDAIDNDLDGLTDEWYDRDPVNGTADCVDPDSNTDDTGEANPTDTDDDDDDFLDTREAYLATDTLADCALNEYHSAWPVDTNNDGSVSVVGDVLQFRGLIGATYGDGEFRKRLDLNGDGSLSVVGDVLVFRGLVGETCFP